MSALEEIMKQGSATAEQIEQAAAVALFQKAAAAEDLDLSTLDDEGLTNAFNHFVEVMLPEMLPEDDGKQASAPTYEEIAAATKVAEIEHAATLHLFQKAAAAYDVDLSVMDEDQLQEAWGLFLEHDLPAMIESDKEASALAELEKEAAANLHEMTVLGQHLGDVFMSTIKEAGFPFPKDDGGKEASAGETPVFDLLARLEAVGQKEASASELSFDDLVAARVAELLGAE